METRISNLIKTLQALKRVHGNLRVIAAKDEELNRMAPMDYGVVKLISGEIVVCTYPIHGGDIE